MQAVLKGVDHNGVQKPGEMAAESFLGFSSIFFLWAAAGGWISWEHNSSCMVITTNLA